MLDRPSDPPALFFAPFVSSSQHPEASWFEDGGRLGEDGYAVLFARGAEEALALLGLGPEELARSGCILVALGSRLTRRREVAAGDPLRVTVQLVDADEERVHAYLELRHAREGWLAASREQVHVHAEAGTRRAAPFPAGVLGNLMLMKAAHGAMPRPEGLGRPLAAEPGAATAH